MERHIFRTAALAAFLMPILFTARAQVVEKKSIDNGGSGLYKSIAVKEKTLPGFTVYRPSHLAEARSRDGALPIVIFCNGGCSDSNIGYERMLSEVSSHGYIVIALGEMQHRTDDRPHGKTPSSDLKKALDWIFKQAATAGNDYHGNADTNRVAAAGHSCGGAQVLANAADPRLKTCIILNAGMGNMEMAGANRWSLSALHCPALYITGGPGDVAYANARTDYSRIAFSPVAIADNPSTGHGGTYHEKNGGDYGRMVTDWLDWQLKGKDINSRIFLEGDTGNYKGWTIEAKGFNISQVWIKNGQRRIYGVVSKPRDKAKRQPLAIITHGFNGTHASARVYFDSLNKLGYQVCAIDLPCGSVYSKSDNNTVNMSITDGKNDLKAVVDHFRRQPDVDKGNIVLVGESQGGLVSALAAAEMPESVRKLVLVFPALCIPRDWNGRYKNISDIPDTTKLWGVPLGRRFFLELREMNVFGDIGKFKRPVMIVQGDKDPVVSLQDSKRAVKDYRKAILRIIPNAGHGFKPHEQAMAQQYIRDFLNEK